MLLRRMFSSSAHSNAAAAAVSAGTLAVNRIHLPSVDSTNSYAKEVARELSGDLYAPPKLHVITADEQTAGRGRLSRSWMSSKDDVKMTFLFKLKPAMLQSAYLLSPLLSIAACDAALKSTGQRLGIKWPNDLIAGGRRKVGGILCEMESVMSSAPLGPSFWAVLGIGLNVNSMPDALGVARPVWPLSTLRAEAGAEHGEATAPPQLDVKAVEDALVASFNEALAEFLSSAASSPSTSSGSLSLSLSPRQLERYRNLSVILGRRIRFNLGDKDNMTVSGVVEDVFLGGSLVVRVDGETSTRSFLSGEVTGLQLDVGEEIRSESTSGE